MTGPRNHLPDLPEPVPADDQAIDADTARDLIIMWSELRPVLLKTLRLRKIMIAILAVILAVLVAAVVLLWVQGRHASQVADCVNIYANHNAQVQRERAEALRRLVDATLHLHHPGDYRRAALAFERQAIPPLPPPGCR
jgi:hypothetical protein